MFQMKRMNSGDDCARLEERRSVSTKKNHKVSCLLGQESNDNFKNTHDQSSKIDKTSQEENSKKSQNSKDKDKDTITYIYTPVSL